MSIRKLLFLSSAPFILSATPIAPSNLKLDATSTTVALSWSDNAQNESGYKIFRNDTLIAITDADVSSYEDKGLTPNTTYHYTIKATDDIFGAKKDNSGDGSYYPYDDKDAIRGLKFDAYRAFTLHSVKVYNQKGEASNRTFTLLDSSGTVIASKTVFVPEGESRVSLEFEVPQGDGYKLIADTHKGLYRNTNVNGYPYAIGDVGSIVSANENSTNYYYFFYDWDVEEASPSGISTLSDYSFIGSGYGAFSTPSKPSADNQAPYIPDLTDLAGYNIIYIKPNGTGDGTSEANAKSIYDVFPSTYDEAKDKTLQHSVIVAMQGEYNIKKNLFFPKTTEDVIFISQKRHQAKLIMAHEPLNENNTPETDYNLLHRNDKGKWKEDRSNALFKKLVHASIKKFAMIGFESYPAELDANGNVIKDENGNIKPQDFVQPYKDEELNWKEDPNDTKVFKNWNNLTEENLRKALKHSRNFLKIPDDSSYDNISEEVYIADMKFHNYEGVVFSGRNSSKFTIDRTLFYHSNGSYLWYMQGWQNAVINTVAYDCDGYALSVRGGDASNSDKKWTALIAYNTFGETDSKRFRNNDRNEHIGIYSWDDEDDIRSGEVFIQNNISVGKQMKYYDYENGVTKEQPLESNIGLLNINISGNDTNIIVRTKNNITDNNDKSHFPYANKDYENNQKDDIKDSIIVTNIPFKRTTQNDNGLRDYSIISANSSIKDKATTENWKPNVDASGNLRDNKPDIGAYEVK